MFTPSTDDFGKKLVEALGLPPRVTKLVITVEVGEPVSVQCDYYPDIDSAQLVTVLGTLEAKLPLEPGQIDITTIESQDRKYLRLEKG